ncbi:Na/Pi cotransporter family protein [Methyloceanibacter sp.]|uniref:Na/Pi cotransporter family protein n=1 Tax=Methyloceanibacter sp. TaxID=1965321 RepID=UPI0020844737|nr:Na/Pi cotransporter family protein [Methyloceanibacter sp.]GFO82001.1 MAG: Na/Pi cotransporter [Methyloceanibacter sp.]HML90814.1 Na/Pi cotransporter family protein [Methyloceanibacter sp.]
MSDLDLLQIIGLLLGGLAIFLFGLQLMTGGLTAIAGARMQMLLGTLTANRFRGVLAGAGVTALLNSSTITTVLLVGFVSAGLMTVVQTVPMIMGANIGSTFTAQLIAFNLSAITPFILAAGFFLQAFAKRELMRQFGGILLGFGLLFLGIHFMGEATRPLRTFQPFIDLMQEMRNPLVGILIGAIFTAIVQSSAATLGIIIALASQGLMPLEAGIALVLGANVGTVGTALLSAIGKSAEALQVGIVHLIFNCFGVLLFVFFIPEFAELVRYVSPAAPDLQGVERFAAETPRQVANAHTIFSVASTFVLIWFVVPIARLAEYLVPAGKGEVTTPGDPVYLDESALKVPAAALKRVRLELTRLGDHVLDTVRRGRKTTVEGTIDDIGTLLEADKETRKLATAILHYIGRASRETGEDSRQMIDLAQIVTSLEGISDVVTSNLVSVCQQRLAEGISLAPLKDENTDRFARAVLDSLKQAVEAINAPDAAKAAAEVVDAKAEIDALAAAARQSIFNKLQLDEKADAVNFRLASDMIEQFKQVARFSRAIAQTAQGI